MGELAVDFGTSNTVAAVRADGSEPPRLLTFGGWPVLPSAVWLGPDGQLVVGRDAERQARLDPARFEPNPKRRIDDGEVLLGDRVLGVTELIAAVLRRVFDEATRQLGGSRWHLVLTHPAGWGAARQDVLVTAARRAGAGSAPRLLPEPVAAAARFAATEGHRPAPGQGLAVLDLGGGTTDAAVVERTADSWRVLAEAGLPDVGGADTDQLLLDLVGAQLGNPAQWAALLRPGTAADRRAARALRDDIRAAKEALSEYPHADVPLPPPLPDAHVTRAELERLARPSLTRAADLLGSAIASAGRSPAALSGVYLVGGASRMPLVAALLAERLGVLPVVLDSPEAAVALGALTSPPASPARYAVPAPQDGPAQPAPPVEPPTVRYGSSSATGPPVPGDPARPAAARRGSRARVALIAGILAGVLLLGAAGVAMALSLRSGSSGAAGPSRTASATDPVTTDRATSDPATTAPATVDPATTGADPGLGPAGSVVVPSATPAGQSAKDGTFGTDADLRDFAGPAVDRALNCVNPGGSADSTFHWRTHVQCVYDQGGTLLYASFFAGESAQSCATLGTAFGLGAPGTGSGSWSGGRWSGTWQDATLLTPATYYTDAGRQLCGLVEGDENHPPAAAVVHGFWDAMIRPGS